MRLHFENTKGAIMRVKQFLGLWCVIGFGLSACNVAPAPSVTAPPTVAPTSAVAPTPTVAATPTKAATRTPTPTVLPTFTPLPVSVEFPKIDRQPAVADWGRGSLMSAPSYDPNSEEMWQMDLRSYDLSSLDLSDSLDDLLFASFDAQTQWPPAAKMPAKFDWQRMMELGKNPGLGMRQLHAQGITGKGVGLAIIDQPLIVEHQEYADRMRLYQETNIDSTTESKMHGPAVASIAVGKTVGVAPGADLYYIAAWAGEWGTGDGGFAWNFGYYAQAVRHILQINQQLPEDRKIRVIAMQIGWSPDQGGYDEIMAAVKEAKEAGLLVVSSSLAETFGFSFHGLGRAPLADPNKFESYEAGLWWAKDFYTHPEWVADTLLVPMDSRTTASPGGAEEYVFYREGGWSWSIPYIAGMYALAAQVEPSITPDEFWSRALKTGQTIELKHDGKTIPFGPILDPAALIKSLQTQ